MLLQAGFRDAGDVARAPGPGWTECGVLSGSFYTTRAGSRVTPWEAFVRPVLHLPRGSGLPGPSKAGPALVLRDACTVVRVLMEPETGAAAAGGEGGRGWRAVGVEVAEASGRRRRLILGRAGAEVVLCCGAVFTPQARPRGPLCRRMPRKERLREG